MDLYLDIEAATYASWPAFEQIEYRGWILRAAQGCTKRTNSVNVITATDGDMMGSVAHCEAFYRERKLPTIFRQLSFIDDSKLDRYLADVGYLFFDPSMVLYQPLDGSLMEKPVTSDLDREAWFPLFCDVGGQNPDEMAVHARIIERVPAQSIFVAALEDGSAAAVGFGVIHEGCFGIFDVVTRPEYRRRGHSTGLIRQMLSWAQQNDARHAYVQVVANNTGAIRLYENLGYRRLYHYWYRLQNCTKT